MTRYVPIKETECASETQFDFFVDEREMLSDIKAILAEYYVATFTSDENALTVGFNNGQKFLVCVKAIR